MQNIIWLYFIKKIIQKNIEKNLERNRKMH